MYRKTEELNPHQLYNIFIGSVVPRPIAWVSTVNQQGQPNLAPFSFFMVASANPPVVCFCPALKSVQQGGERLVVPKDTLRNIQDTGEFVVNIVSLSLAEQMNQSSASFAPDVNEFEKANLTEAPSQAVAPPRVGEALVSFECKLRQLISFGKHEGAGNLVLGDVVGFHLEDSVWQNNHIDISVLEPIGRLSGNDYCKIESIFQLERPEI
jgi:flavin reductase (DIM6/NTAB) family NADH-FMN oxidoreductase RutF